jgi:DNA-binding transcriptional LysR family regulator
MDESKLRMFTCVAQHKSFAKAAQELHVVTSTVSRNIAALETELHTKLFYRDTHIVELTPAGQRLYDEASSYLEHFSFITQNVFALLEQDENRISLTCGPMEFALVRQLMRQYRQHNPAAMLQLSTFPSYEIRPLKNGTANFFITARSCVGSLDGYQHIPLGTYRWKAVAHRDSSFWQLPPEKQALLWGQRLVRPSPQNVSPVTLWLPEHPLEIRGTTASRPFSVTCTHLALEGVAILPEYLEPWLPSFLRMEQVFPEPPVEEAVLVFNADRASPQEQQFFDYIRDHFRP